MCTCATQHGMSQRHVIITGWVDYAHDYDGRRCGVHACKCKMTSSAVLFQRESVGTSYSDPKCLRNCLTSCTTLWERVFFHASNLLTHMLAHIIHALISACQMVRPVIAKQSLSFLD